MKRMRRRDRRIDDESVVQDILENGLVCHLGLHDGQYPYVVPMSYGYRDGRIYVHCAREGRKVDILRKNDRVCVEVDVDARIVRGEPSCRWSMKYRSVIGFGRARILEDEAEKRAGLDAIMDHYGGSGGDYEEKSLRATCVVEIRLESITGKQSL